MPGGLNEVVQPVGADASRYIEEYRAALAVTKELSAANKELMRTVAETQNAIKGAGGGASSAGVSAEDIAKVNAGIRDQLKLLGDHSSVIREATTAGAGFSSVQEQIAKIVRDSADAARETTLAMGDLAVSHGKVRDTAVDGGSAIRSYSSDVGALKQSVTEVRAALDDTSRSIDVLTAKAAGAGASTTGILGADLAGRMGGGFFAGGGGGGGGSGGGGGGGGWAALAAAAAGPPGGGWDKGTAGSMWGTVGTFLGTWLPRAHYVLMAANELAATLGPATVAAGMGALVGMQGGEQAIPRLQAVYATAESLGPSLGTTAGQYMGLKGSPLQTAQNLATGAAFEGIGAMTNILRAGAGNAFIQLGSNTVSMWSRMMANLTQEFQGGMGNQLGGLVSGGPGTWRSSGRSSGTSGTCS